MYSPRPATDDQMKFIRALQSKLKLNDATMDIQSKRMFGVPVAEITIKQASMLIDELKTWKDVPAALRRAMGQADLF